MIAVIVREFRTSCRTARQAPVPRCIQGSGTDRLAEFAPGTQPRWKSCRRLGLHDFPCPARLAGDRARSGSAPSSPAGSTEVDPISWTE